jgi:predicted Zn-dependent protease
MLRLTKSDEELAFLIGHELAHNCLRHIAKKRWGWFLWPTFDAFVHGWKGTEMEADRLGIYIMARTDYDIAGAQKYLRHMATEFPVNIKPEFIDRHPSTPERVMVLEKTIAEIQRKVAAGEPLVP